MDPVLAVGAWSLFLVFRLSLARQVAVEKRPSQEYVSLAG